MEKEVKKPEMENCVMCGIETDVPITMPVDLRHNYVEGAGQLCPKCYVKAFPIPENFMHDERKHD